MAHNLNIIKGEAAFAYFGDHPWHKLGLKVPGRMTIREALVAGRLDWYVDLMPLTTHADLVCNPDGSMENLPPIEVETHAATVRRDTKKILGIVGSDYKVVQNLEAFAFFEEALGQGVAVIETVGALGNGERIFAMAKMPEAVEVVPGDVVEQFLLLTSSHDGTGAIKVLFTPVRVVCQNTLTAALRGARNAVSIKHTKNAKDALKEAHRVLKASDTFWQKQRDALQFMASKEMSTGEVKDFLKNLFPAKKVLDEATGEEHEEETSVRQENIMDRIETLFNGQATGSEMAKKTRWGMLNAVTHYIDHERTVRTRKDGTKPEQWETSVFGLGSALRQRATDLLLGDQPKPEKKEAVAV